MRNDSAASSPTVLRLAVDGRVLDDRYHGIGRITEALLRQWAGRVDVEVIVFVRAQQRSERFDVERLIAESGYRRAEFDLPLTSPLQWLRWPSALRTADVDAVLFPYHLGAAVMSRAHRVAIVHDCILEADPAYAPDTRTRVLYKLLTAVVARRTTVLAPSLASAKDIEHHYRVQVPQHNVVPWAVDPDFAVTESWGPKAASPSLPVRFHLHVGARRPHKNVATLIKALAHLPESDALVLVGTIDERWDDTLNRLATSLGVADRVVHLQNVTESDLREIYARASTFLYPSHVEGFGLPLLEAMAAGLPVVASDIPVFREVAAGAAVLVDANDASQWAAAITDLSDTARRNDAVTAGRARAAAWSWAAAADRTLEAVRTAASKAHADAISR